jgi:hypothetical protein
MRNNGLNDKVQKHLVDMAVGTTVKHLEGSSVKAILFNIAILCPKYNLVTTLQPDTQGFHFRNPEYQVDKIIVY